MFRYIALGSLAIFCLLTFLPVDGCAVVYGSAEWSVGSGVDASPATVDYEQDPSKTPCRFRAATSTVLDLNGTGLSEAVTDELATSIRSVAQHIHSETFDASSSTYQPENGWLPDLVMLSELRSTSGSLHVVRSQDYADLSVAIGRAPIRFEGYREGPWGAARAEWEFAIQRKFTGLQSPAARKNQITWLAGKHWRKSARDLQWPRPPKPSEKPATALEDPVFPIKGDFEARAIYTGRRRNGRQETLWRVTSPLGFYDARDALVSASASSQWTSLETRSSVEGRFVSGAFQRGTDDQAEWLQVVPFWDESSVRQEGAGPEPIAVLHASAPQ